LKAAGLSLHRISLPVLVLAGAVSAGAFVFQETAAPMLNAKGEEVDRVEIRKTSASGSRPQLHWYRRSDSEFVRIDRLDRALRQVSGITLIQRDANFRLVKRVDAAQAVWASDGLELDRSVEREFGPDDTVQTESGSATPLRLPDSLEALGAMPAPSAMTFAELRAYVRHMRERGQAVGAQVLYLHSKLSFPLMSLVLAVLAISCAARWPQGGRVIGSNRRRDRDRVLGGQLRSPFARPGGPPATDRRRVGGEHRLRGDRRLALRPHAGVKAEAMPRAAGRSTPPPDATQRGTARGRPGTP